MAKSLSDIHLTVPVGLLPKTPEEYAADYADALKVSQLEADKVLSIANGYGVAVPKPDGSGYYNDVSNSTEKLKTLARSFGMPEDLFLK